MQNKVYEKYEEVQAVAKQMIDALETRLREDGFSPCLHEWTEETLSANRVIGTPRIYPWGAVS